jgi:hypothetical protein
MNSFLTLTRTLNITKPIFSQLHRMSSSYLINDPKYSFLKELGLQEKNNGVFARHGEWFGKGQVKL